MPYWVVVLVVYVACLCNSAKSVNPAPENCLNYESSYHIDRGCDCVVYQSYGLNKGHFTSPNFPEFYPPNTNCILYSFFGDTYEIIELTFLEFDLKMPDIHGKCIDFVRIFQNLDRPEVNENSKHDVELCGSYSNLKKKKFYSSNRSLVFEFHTENHSGQNSSFQGFNGIYQFLDKRKFITTGTQVEGQVCTYVFNSNHTHKSGRFFSPFYPQTYRPNDRCRYNFYALPGERVRVVFDNIQLHLSQTSTFQCAAAADIVKVYDGEDTDTTLLDQYCGVHNSPEVTSSDNRLLVTFQSDRHHEEQGFAATYEFISKSPQNKPRPTKVSPNSYPMPTLSPSTRCGEIISSVEKKNGTIESPGYPNAYPSDLTCRFTFQGVGRERVQLCFVHMDLHYPSGNVDSPEDCTGSDSVSVYITVNGRNEVLGTFCGHKLPSILMSNSNTMTVEFRSYRSSPMVTGFQAKYGFVTNYGIDTGKQDERGMCIFSYKSHIETEGKISSPNYPGLYPRDTECHYLFYGRGTERVHISFLYFEVDGIPPRCEEFTKSDYLSFSNFADTEDRKLYRMCTQSPQTNPRVVQSDGAFFRVTFKSNDIYDGHGFEAFYQFRDSADPHPGKNTDSVSNAASAVSSGMKLMSSPTHSLLALVITTIATSSLFTNVTFLILSLFVHGLILTTSESTCIL